MDGYGRRGRWALVLVVVLVSAAVGLVGYNVGLLHGTGVASSGDMEMYGWHRPWGFGLMFPFLFFALWIVLFRGFWGWGGGPWSWRHRYYPDRYGPETHFDEWHRRAHERMKEGPPADDPGRRG